MSISQCSPMQINNINKKYITEPKITFEYQLNLSKSSSKPINPLNEKIILEHVESCWRQECLVGDRRIVNTDWVRLTFRKIPTEGTFNLIQDPDDMGNPSMCGVNSLIALSYKPMLFINSFIIYINAWH